MAKAIMTTEQRLRYDRLLASRGIPPEKRLPEARALAMEGWESIQRLKLQRLKVPSGWIIKSNQNLAWMSDPKHEWQPMG
jgi:hypothetical protein